MEYFFKFNYQIKGLPAVLYQSVNLNQFFSLEIVEEIHQNLEQQII